MSPVAFGLDEVRRELNRQLKRRPGAAKQLAFRAKCSPSLLNRIAKGDCMPNEEVAAALGFRRELRFERVG